VEQPVTAVVTVEEAARYSMRYGVQFTRTREVTGTEITYGPGAGADFRDRDFLGRAIAAGVGLRYDRRNQSVQGLLATRRTYGADVRSNLFITGRRERSTAGADFAVQDNTFSVTAEQRKRLSTYLELAWAFAYDYRRLAVRRAQDDVLALPFTGDTVGPRLALAWDSRDNPFDATRGWFHSSAVDFGVRPLGSDLSYARYLLQHFQFVPIGRVVLASGVRFGALHAFGDQADVHPVSFDLLFTAGGSHSVRGYAEDSLGPAPIANLRLGNRQLLVLNQEVRFPLFRWFKGVAFIDAGNTFPGLGDLSLGNLRLGAGAGLRLSTPVGLFRMDVGWPIDPRPEDTTRVYFSVGQAF
jgi:translocation and assembly module TamA